MFICIFWGFVDRNKECTTKECPRNAVPCCQLWGGAFTCPHSPIQVQKVLFISTVTCSLGCELGGEDLTPAPLSGGGLKFGHDQDRKILDCH